MHKKKLVLYGIMTAVRLMYNALFRPCLGRVAFCLQTSVVHNSYNIIVKSRLSRIS